jgi:hypothetical protein
MMMISASWAYDRSGAPDQEAAAREQLDAAHVVEVRVRHDHVGHVGGCEPTASIRRSTRIPSVNAGPVIEAGGP